MPYVNIEEEMRKDPRLALKVLEKRENNISEDKIRSYVIGWTKKPSQEKHSKPKKKR